MPLLISSKFFTWSGFGSVTKDHSFLFSKNPLRTCNVDGDDFSRCLLRNIFASPNLVCTRCGTTQGSRTPTGSSGMGGLEVVARHLRLANHWVYPKATKTLESRTLRRHVVTEMDKIYAHLKPINKIHEIDTRNLLDQVQTETRATGDCALPHVLPTAKQTNKDLKG